MGINCIGTTALVHNFFNVPKRQNILRKSIKTISSTKKAQKLGQICATRSVDRQESVSTFSNLQFTVEKVWQKFQHGQTEKFHHELCSCYRQLGKVNFALLS